MNIDIKKVKVIVTAPMEAIEEIRKVVCNEGAGIIGNYTYCTVSTLREVHPYEELGIDIIPLISEEDL